MIKDLWNWAKDHFTRKFTIPFHVAGGVICALLIPRYPQFAITLFVAFGVFEYWILQPEPLVAETAGVSWALLAVALILATGFVEEFAFRGVMQRSALDAYGTFGVVLVAAVFAALHIGWLSLFDVAFVFAIGLVFSYLTIKTGSLLGVAVSHGLTNVTLFLIMPFLGS